MKSTIAIAALLVWVATALPAAAQDVLPKKLIEYGWDVPVPSFVQQHVRDMEQRPFDGLIFHVPDFDHGFDPSAWDAAKVKSQIDTLKSIRWQRFTDNFLILYAANKWNMDWFDDAQWERIEANLRAASKMAKAAHCVGICFDPEPYGTNPWAFETAAKGHTYGETYAAVRKRGAQFMRALRSDMPDVRILSFYLLSMYRDVALMPTAAQREAFFTQPGRKARWGLVVPFVVGWLDAASPRNVIVDGNEHSYYHNTSEWFYKDYYITKQQMQTFIPPERRKAYRDCVQSGMALYMDELVSLRDAKDNPVGVSLSPDDRLLWLEHNTYMALHCTDEYVWCYSEKMSWWENKIPDGMEAAIRRARTKIATGEPLGFDIADVMARRKK